MDIHAYADEVIKKLDEMTDEEFIQALYAAGLDRCPVIEFENGSKIVTVEDKGTTVRSKIHYIE